MNFEPFLDVTNVQPDQGGAKHPIGKKFPAIISNTGIKSTKDNDGGYLFITFTTPAGTIDKKYNIWNKSEQAVDIAKKQYAVVAHALGIYKVHVTLPDGSPDFQNAASELRNQRLMIDVDFQKGHEPSADKPAGGYVEVSKVYDANGNEPGKAPAAAPQPQQGQSGGWNAAPAQAPQGTVPPAGQAWPAAQNNAPLPAAAPPNAGGWTPGPSAPAGQNPPWAGGNR